MKKSALLAFAIVFVAPALSHLRAQTASQEICPRPAIGSEVPEPADLRSENGVLKVDLTIYNHAEPDGSTRYCYVDANGNQSPNLRVQPGDLVILNLKND